jgi:signal peptide peptidase SppA
MSLERFSHVQRLIREHPWALLSTVFEAMLEIVERRADGVELSAEEIDARISAARPQRQAVESPGSIAVLPVYGIISHRIRMVENISGPGGTSAEGIGQALSAALAAPDIGAIVLDVDSPGGSVAGIEELGNQIHSSRGSKPIVAVANSMAGSAAYWLASQADELVVTPSGQIGSIGVFGIHDDISKAAEQKGVRRTFISAGRFKTEGNPFEPLGDEARAHMQAVVDGYYSDFVRAVARGRGVSMSKVRSEFGEGRLVRAEQAVAAGMADREATLQETIERLAVKMRRSAGARSSTSEPALADTSEAPVQTSAPAAAAESAAPAIDLERERMRLALAARARRA